MMNTTNPTAAALDTCASELLREVETLQSDRFWERVEGLQICGPSRAPVRSLLGTGARPGGSACPSDRLQRGGPGMSIWGRVQVGGQWRPAYISTAGFFVSPHIGGPWRPGTSRERAGFQERIACHQHTTGRIWDDELYTAPAIVVSGVE